MNTKYDTLYLLDMYERIERIETFVQEGKTVFFESNLVQDAVIRNFEVFGEAANRIWKIIENDLPTLKSQIATMLERE